MPGYVGMVTGTEKLHHIVGITVPDSGAKVADSAVLAETEAFPERSHGIGEGGAVPRHVRDRLSGQLCITVPEVTGIAVAESGVADIAQYRSGFNGCELVPVSQENQARLHRQCPEQFGEKGQIHHGGFVDNQDVHRQGPSFMIARTRLVGEGPQETVERGGAVGNGCLHGFRCRQQSPGLTDGLEKAGSRLSCRRGQGDAQGFVGMLLQQKGKHGGYRRGFSRAGTAGNDAEMLADCRIGRYFPPGKRRPFLFRERA